MNRPCSWFENRVEKLLPPPRRAWPIVPAESACQSAAPNLELRELCYRYLPIGSKALAVKLDVLYLV